MPASTHPCRASRNVARAPSADAANIATYDCVIVGSGLAGLSCAHHFSGQAAVLEADGHVGGTAASTNVDGFTFDVTGHWLHLRQSAMRSLIDSLCPKQFARHERRAEVALGDVRTPYPFQAHTFGHAPKLVADCVLGFFAAQRRVHATPPQNFADYVRRAMGDGIAEHFMLPYNRKLWCVPAEDLAYEWCGRFVPLPTAEEIVWGALRPEGAGRALGYNSAFFYPKVGGIGLLAAALAQKQRHPLYLRCRVVGVDVRRRQLHCADGRRFGYRKLVSTMPLPTLVAAAVKHGNVPAAVVAAAAQLRATQLTYWNVGLRRSAQAAGVGTAHWTYFPGPEVPFFRVGSPSAVRPTLAPNGGRSYAVEVAHLADAPCPTDDAGVLAGLRAAGLVGATEEPVVWQRRNLPCAYVIMDQAYGQARATVLAWLRHQGIFSTGRFGSWTYDSMEGALAQGRQVAHDVQQALALAVPDGAGAAAVGRKQRAQLGAAEAGTTAPKPAPAPAARP